MGEDQRHDFAPQITDVQGFAIGFTFQPLRRHQEEGAETLVLLEDFAQGVNEVIHHIPYGDQFVVVIPQTLQQLNYVDR